MIVLMYTISFFGMLFVLWLYHDRSYNRKINSEFHIDELVQIGEASQDMLIKPTDKKEDSN